MTCTKRYACFYGGSVGLAGHALYVHGHFCDVCGCFRPNGAYPAPREVAPEVSKDRVTHIIGPLVKTPCDKAALEQRQHSEGKVKGTLKQQVSVWLERHRSGR